MGNLKAQAAALGSLYDVGVDMNVVYQGLGGQATEEQWAAATDGFRTDASIQSGKVSDALGDYAALIAERIAGFQSDAASLADQLLVAIDATPSTAAIAFQRAKLAVWRNDFTAPNVDNPFPALEFAFSAANRLSDVYDETFSKSSDANFLVDSFRKYLTVMNDVSPLSDKVATLFSQPEYLRLVTAVCIDFMDIFAQIRVLGQYRTHHRAITYGTQNNCTLSRVPLSAPAQLACSNLKTEIADLQTIVTVTETFINSLSGAVSSSITTSIWASQPANSWFVSAITRWTSLYTMLGLGVVTVTQSTLLTFIQSEHPSEPMAGLISAQRSNSRVCGWTSWTSVPALYYTTLQLVGPASTAANPVALLTALSAVTSSVVNSFPMLTFQCCAPVARRHALEISSESTPSESNSKSSESNSTSSDLHPPRQLAALQGYPVGAPYLLGVPYVCAPTGAFQCADDCSAGVAGVYCVEDLNLMEVVRNYAPAGYYALPAFSATPVSHYYLDENAVVNEAYYYGLQQCTNPIPATAVYNTVGWGTATCPFLCTLPGERLNAALGTCVSADVGYYSPANDNAQYPCPRDGHPSPLYEFAPVSPAPASGAACSLRVNAQLTVEPPAGLPWATLAPQLVPASPTVPWRVSMWLTLQRNPPALETVGLAAVPGYWSLELRYTAAAVATVALTVGAPAVSTVTDPLPALISGTTFHLQCEVAADTVSMTIDGVVVVDHVALPAGTQAALAASSPFAPAGFRLGGNTAAGTTFFAGVMRDFVISNTTWSAWRSGALWTIDSHETLHCDPVYQIPDTVGSRCLTRAFSLAGSSSTLASPYCPNPAHQWCQGQCYPACLDATMARGADCQCRCGRDSFAVWSVTHLRLTVTAGVGVGDGSAALGAVEVFGPYGVYLAPEACTAVETAASCLGLTRAGGRTGYHSGLPAVTLTLKLSADGSPARAVSRISLVKWYSASPAGSAVSVAISASRDGGVTFLPVTEQGAIALVFPGPTGVAFAALTKAHVHNIVSRSITLADSPLLSCALCGGAGAGRTLASASSGVTGGTSEASCACSRDRLPVLGVCHLALSPPTLSVPAGTVSPTSPLAVTLAPAVDALWDPLYFEPVTTLYGFSAAACTTPGPAASLAAPIATTLYAVSQAADRLSSAPASAAYTVLGTLVLTVSPAFGSVLSSAATPITLSCSSLNVGQAALDAPPYSKTVVFGWSAALTGLSQYTGSPVSPVLAVSSTAGTVPLSASCSASLHTTVSISGTFTYKAPAPTLSPAPSTTRDHEVVVTPASVVAGATFQYRLGASGPFTVYASPVLLTCGATVGTCTVLVQWTAAHPQWVTSDPASFTYTIDNAQLNQSPTFAVLSSNPAPTGWRVRLVSPYADPAVTFAVRDEFGTTLTLDNVAGVPLTAPGSRSFTAWLVAGAVRGPDAVFSATVAPNPVTAPVMTVAGGCAADRGIAMTCLSLAAIPHYTSDGTVPVRASPVFPVAGITLSVATGQPLQNVALTGVCFPPLVSDPPSDPTAVTYCVNPTPPAPSAAPSATPIVLPTAAPARVKPVIFSTAASGSSTSESPAGPVVTIVLSLRNATEATADLSSWQVYAASNDSREGSVISGGLTPLQNQSLLATATVRVQGVDDLVADGSIRYEVQLFLIPEMTSAPGLGALPDAVVVLTNLDDDVAGIDCVLPPPQAATSLAVEKRGALNGTLSVRLTSVPAGPVTVRLTATPAGLVTLSKAELVFTPANARDAVEVRVTGVDDNVPTGARAFSVSLEAFPSALPQDIAYARVARTVSGTLYDPRRCGLLPFATSATTSEGGATATIVVSADANFYLPASGPRRVRVTTSDATEGTASVSELVFASRDEVHTVLVTGVDDSLADGPVTYSIVFESLGCSVAVEMRNTDNDLAEIVLARPRSGGCVTSELGTPYPLAVSLGGSPSPGQVVLVSFAMHPVQVATFDGGSGGVALFTSTDWSVPQTISVMGLRRAAADASTADRNFTVLPATVLDASDPIFLGVSTAPIACVNTDIVWPTIAGIAPLTVPPAADAGAGRLTITGSNLSPFTAVYIGPVRISLDTTLGTPERLVCIVPSSLLATSSNPTTSTSPKSARGLLPSRFTATSSTNASSSATSPAYLNGPQVLRVINPDGGFFNLADRLWVSPCLEGTKELASGECIPCPLGDECPGGARAWPAEGNLRSGGPAPALVSECRPNTPCDSSANLTCAAGYEGTYCSRCVKGYFKRGKECRACGDSRLLTYRLLAMLGSMAVLLGLFLLAGFLCTDATFTDLVEAMGALQIIQAVGRVSVGSLPAVVESFYQYLGVIALDFNFLLPGCSGLSSATQVFVGNILFAVCVVTASGLLFRVVGRAHVRVLVKRLARLQGPTGRELLEREIETKEFFYRNRFYRIVLLLPYLMYVSMTNEILNVMYCMRGADGKLHLVADMSQQCFVGSHLYVFVVATVLLVVYAGGLPIATSILLYVYHGRLVVSPTGRARFGFLFEQYHEGAYLVGISVYYVYAGLAISAVLLPQAPLAQLVFACVLLCVYGAYMAYRRPGHTLLDDAVSVGASIVGILSLVLNYLALHSSGALSPAALERFALFLFVLGVGVVLCVLAVVVKAVRDNRHRTETEAIIRKIDPRDAADDQVDSDPAIKGKFSTKYSKDNNDLDDDYDNQTEVVPIGSVHGGGNVQAADQVSRRTQSKNKSGTDPIRKSPNLELGEFEHEKFANGKISTSTTKKYDEKSDPSVPNSWRMSEAGDNVHHDDEEYDEEEEEHDTRGWGGILGQL